MRTLGQLTKTELIDIVRRVHSWMYQDTSAVGTVYDPDNEIGGADTIDELTLVMEKYGLCPKVRVCVYIPFEDLTALFTRAAEAGNAVNTGEDGGTCNFDQATVRLPGDIETNIQLAAGCGLSLAYREASGRKGDMWGGRYFAAIPVSTGQGARRTNVAEAIHQVFADAGLDALMYYQID